MADDLGDGDADDERAVELSSLAAIYPELERNPARDPFSASIVIVVEPILPLKIRFPSADGAPPTGLPTPPGSTSEGISQLKVNDERDSIQQVKNANQGIHLLSHLPPLILRLSLPEGYPAKKPPVLLLESQHSWLPGGKLRELREAGHTLWEEVGRDQVLFAYIDHLQDSAESGFGLDTLEILSDLKVSLLDFDLQAKRQKFERQTFECGICLGRFCWV